MPRAAPYAPQDVSMQRRVGAAEMGVPVAKQGNSTRRKEQLPACCAKRGAMPQTSRVSAALNVSLVDVPVGSLGQGARAKVGLKMTPDASAVALLVPLDEGFQIKKSMSAKNGKTTALIAVALLMT